jgi:hypothetical protein
VTAHLDGAAARAAAEQHLRARAIIGRRLRVALARARSLPPAAADGSELQRLATAARTVCGFTAAADVAEADAVLARWAPLNAAAALLARVSGSFYHSLNCLSRFLTV